MKTGFQFKINYWALQFMLSFVKPIVEINDEKQNINNWGNSYLDLPPGAYTIRIYFSYLFWSRAGLCEFHIHLCESEVINIDYMAPFFVGNDGLVKITRPNQQEQPIFHGYMDAEQRSQLDPEELRRMKNNGLYFKVPVPLVVTLHVLTFGISSLLYFAVLHYFLPQLKKKDHSVYKAVLLLFIPYYNFYWMLAFLPRFENRINLQLNLRGSSELTNPRFAQLGTFLLLVPYVNFVIHLVMFPMYAAKLQHAINQLVDLNIAELPDKVEEQHTSMNPTPQVAAATQSNAGMQQKECPECCNMIPAVAVKCKYCHTPV